jgi:hypothetical protein
MKTKAKRKKETFASLLHQIEIICSINQCFAVKLVQEWKP